MVPRKSRPYMDVIFFKEVYMKKIKVLKKHTTNNRIDELENHLNKYTEGEIKC